MRIEAFMDFLFYALAVAGVFLLAWMILTRLLGIGPPKLHRPFAVWGYVKEAWVIFPKVSWCGWLLTVVFVVFNVTVVLTVALFSDSSTVSSDDAVEAMFRNIIPIKDYLINALLGLPANIFFSTMYITRSFKAAATELFMFVILYCVWKFKDNVDSVQIIEISKIYRYLLSGAGVVLIITAGQLAYLFFPGFIGSIAGGFGIIGDAAATIKYCALLLSASVAEGIFLVVLLGSLGGETLSAKNAFTKAVPSFKPLYLFNLCFFGVPYLLYILGRAFTIPNYLPGGGVSVTVSGMDFIGGTIARACVWLLSMAFLLAPFVIVGEQADLKDALKKTIKTVTGFPADYAIVVVTVSIAAMFATSLFRFASMYVILPLFKSYYVWWTFNSLIPYVLFIWFSLFAFCIFAVFYRQKFLYEGKNPPPSV